MGRQSTIHRFKSKEYFITTFKIFIELTKETQNCRYCLTTDRHGVHVISFRGTKISFRDYDLLTVLEEVIKYINENRVFSRNVNNSSTIYKYILK